MDSESTEKNQLTSTSESTTNVVDKLSNGCATQVENVQAKSEEAAAAGKPAQAAEEAAAEAAAGKAATPEEAPAAIKSSPAAEQAATETVDKKPATPAAADDKLKLKLNNKNCSVKKKEKVTASKVNGLKQQDKMKAQPASNSLKTQEPPNEKLLQAPQLSNGLPNGKKQSVEEESVKSVDKEQNKRVKKQQEAPLVPSLKLAPPINGKTKKNNHRIPVDNVSKESSAAASAASTAPKSQSDAIEPPNKRPKLQLNEKILNKTDPAINLPEPAAVIPQAHNEDELEDTSDEAYLVRHQRALIEERRRFETFLKLSWTNRSRANRRADSRAESSGANTPDPASPAASLHLLGPAADNESIPSPLAQTLQQHPLDAINNDSAIQTDVAQTATTVKRQERRRTTSSKLKEHDRRSATPDTREVR